MNWEPRMTIVAMIVPMLVKSEVKFCPLAITETTSVLAKSSASIPEPGPPRKLRSWAFSGNHCIFGRY